MCKLAHSTVTAQAESRSTLTSNEKGADRKVLRRHESSLYKRCNGVRTRTPDSRFDRSLANNYRSSEIVILQPATNQKYIFSG
jgi:hypothetical protein